MEQLKESLNEGDYNLIKEKGFIANSSKYTYKTSEEDESPNSWEAKLYKMILMLFIGALVIKIALFYVDKIFKH